MRQNRQDKTKGMREKKIRKKEGNAEEKML